MIAFDSHVAVLFNFAKLYSMTCLCSEQHKHISSKACSFWCLRTFYTLQKQTHFSKPAAFCYWTLWDLKQKTSFPYTVWQHNLLMSKRSPHSKSCVKDCATVQFPKLISLKFSLLPKGFKRQDECSSRDVATLPHGDYFPDSLLEQRGWRFICFFWLSLMTKKKLYRQPWLHNMQHQI